MIQKSDMVKLFEKFSLNFSILLFFNPCKSSPSLTILVPLWFIWCCSIFVKRYFQVSFNLKVILSMFKILSQSPFNIAIVKHH